MASPVLAPIALATPIVASNAVFSVRRASRGVDAMDENPVYAFANMTIAGAQILKGIRAVNELNPELESVFNNSAIGTSVKKVADGSKFIKGVGSVINTTAAHINPFIVVTGLLKVAGAEEKKTELAAESTRLLCMFSAEAAMKNFIGMPYAVKEGEKVVSKAREGSYKKLFRHEQFKALRQLSETVDQLTKASNKAKMLVGGAKGLLFVGASIGGYRLGDLIVKKVLGESKAS